MTTAYTTTDKESRTITLHVEGVEIKMTFTTFRKLFRNGMQTAFVHTNIFDWNDFEKRHFE
jgi:hypothetical protein